MLIQGTTLQLPSATKDLPDRVLNLGEILIAEGRQREVAMVTPMKAPELLYLFNHAWLETDKIVKGLAADLVKAEAQVEKRKLAMSPRRRTRATPSSFSTPSTNCSRTATTRSSPRRSGSRAR